MYVNPSIDCSPPGLTRGLTCYDVHAVSFSVLLDDLVARFEAGDRQEIHHHGRLLIVEAAQEVIFLDGSHNQVRLAGEARSKGHLVNPSCIVTELSECFLKHQQ